MKCRVFLEWLRKYQVLKKDCAARNLGEFIIESIEFVVGLGCRDRNVLLHNV
jgi:hypothetical protein